MKEASYHHGGSNHRCLGTLWSVGCEHIGFAGHHGAVLQLDTFLWLLQS